MEILIPVKSRDLPAARTRKWSRIAAFGFACLTVAQPVAGTANVEENHRVLASFHQGSSRVHVTAQAVVKVFGGEEPRNIPVASSANVHFFDWQAFERSRLKERDQPAESVEPTLWQAYGSYVSVALVLLLAQTMLILELLRQRKKEKIIRGHLRESEARLREAQSIAQCGSWVWDVSRDKTYWSDEMYRILGLIPQSVLATSRLIHPGDDQYYVTKMKEASDMHQLYSAEHRIVRPNGEERIVLESGQPKYDSQQRLVSIVGTLLDITEHRRTERVLRESEDRFRTMADGAPVMMWMSGVDKLCTDFNRGWLTFTGRSIEQEVGNGWAEGVHPDDVQRCIAIYVEAFDKRQPFSMEYRLRRYDGEYHWISDSGSPRFLADGTFAGYIGCCVDIHDRKAAEFARLELARRLMSAQEAERARVARELHDGIGQEIALLGIQMQRAAISDRGGTRLDMRRHAETLRQPDCHRPSRQPSVPSTAFFRIGVPWPVGSNYKTLPGILRPVLHQDCVRVRQHSRKSGQRSGAHLSQSCSGVSPQYCKAQRRHRSSR